MRRVLPAAVVAMALTTVLVGCAAPDDPGPVVDATVLPTVDSLLVQMDGKFKEVRGLTADVQMTDKDGVITGRMKSLVPDYLWMELAKKETGPEGREKVVRSMKVVVSDLVMYLEISDKDAKGRPRAAMTDLRALEKLTKELGVSSDQTVPPPQTNYVIHNFLRAQKEAGAALRVLKAEKDQVTVEVRAKGAAKSLRDEATIGTEDGFLRSVKAFEGGKIKQEMTLTNTKVNNELKASDFVYTPPPGVEVFDLVGAMRKMLGK